MTGSAPVPAAAPEAVNHPLHYGGDTTYEVIKVLEAWGIDDFRLANAIKYIARHEKKGTPLDDLKKAAWYLARQIARIERDSATYDELQRAFEKGCSPHGCSPHGCSDHGVPPRRT